MSKQDYVQLEAVREALEKVVKDKDTVENVLALLEVNTVVMNEDAATNEASPEPDTDNESPPKVKKEFVILVSDPKNEIKGDFMGWVLQIPENEDATEVVNGIKKAAYNFNASKRGRKYPVSTIGQAIDAVGSKFLKPYNVFVKTKEPVLVVKTNNVLPRS